VAVYCKHDGETESFIKDSEYTELLNDSASQGAAGCLGSWLIFIRIKLGF
jgi:hypothetical protein